LPGMWRADPGAKVDVDCFHANTRPMKLTIDLDDIARQLQGYDPVFQVAVEAARRAHDEDGGRPPTLRERLYELDS